MPRGLKFLLYAGVFIGSFILFVYWMLPMEALKTRIVQGVENSLGPGYILRIEDINTYWLTGAKLKNVSIVSTAEGKEEDLFKADQVKARVGLFSLLFGGPKVRFDTKVGKARIEGALHTSDMGWSLDCSLKNVDLGQISFVKRSSGLNLSSSLEGEIQINYDAKQPLRTIGNIDVTIDKLLFKAGEVPLGEMGTFPLPDLSLAGGNSLIKAAIDKGAIHLENFRFKGDDFNLELSGKVFLAPQISRYRMNLQGKFQFSPKLWGVLDPILPVKWLEELKKQKGDDDNYPLSVSGQFFSPQIYSGPVAIYPFKPF